MTTLRTTVLTDVYLMLLLTYTVKTVDRLSLLTNSAKLCQEKTWICWLSSGKDGSTNNIFRDDEIFSSVPFRKNYSDSVLDWNQNNACLRRLLSHTRYSELHEGSFGVVIEQWRKRTVRRKKLSSNLQISPQSNFIKLRWIPQTSCKMYLVVFVWIYLWQKH